MTQNTLRLFVLGSGWGVPFATAAPFPLKLAAWMRMTGIDFEWVVENNPGKGPLGKSPWIEDGTVRMGDSALIIDYLREKHGVPDLDAQLTEQEIAVSTAIQRMLEDHYHQCYEYSLFLGKGGPERLAGFAGEMPFPLSVILPPALRRSLTKQLHARGMGRHSDAVIVAQGSEDIDALEAFLGKKPYFHGDQPTMIDACVFGFLGASVYVAGDNPLYNYAASKPTLWAYCERMRARFFPETLEHLALVQSDLGNGEGAAA